MLRTWLTSFCHRSSQSMAHPQTLSPIEESTSSHAFGDRSASCSVSRPTSQWPTTQRPMDRLNRSTRSWKNTCGCTSTTSRTTGSASSPFPNSHTTIPCIRQLWSHPSLPTRAFTKLKVSLASVASDAAHSVASDLQELHQYLHNQIGCALKQYQVLSALHRLLIPLFQVGDTVWLDSEWAWGSSLGIGWIM